MPDSPRQAWAPLSRGALCALGHGAQLLVPLKSCLGGVAGLLPDRTLTVSISAGVPEVADDDADVFSVKVTTPIVPMGSPAKSISEGHSPGKSGGQEKKKRKKRNKDKDMENGGKKTEDNAEMAKEKDKDRDRDKDKDRERGREEKQ